VAGGEKREVREPRESTEKGHFNFILFLPGNVWNILFIFLTCGSVYMGGTPHKGVYVSSPYQILSIQVTHHIYQSITLFISMHQRQTPFNLHPIL